MKGSIAVPFTSKTWLLMERGMTGATGNFYCGLHEFEDMAFILNLLRPTDTFVDIGANIGSYSILASGHVGAFSIAVEPLPATFARLRANARFNNLDDLVSLHNVGIGLSESTLRFTSTLDTVNHVATELDKGLEYIDVPVVRLDDLTRQQNPICIKIDVEGFEKNVIDGGVATMSKNSLRAVLMELNGSGARYGFHDDDIHNTMLTYGFEPFTYDPFKRQLYPLSNRNDTAGNTLYLRDLNFVKERLVTAVEIQLPWRSISPSS